MKGAATSLTEGSIFRGMLRFALPLLCGSLFQQFYTIMDSVIVGNLLGADALASVSGTSSLIYLLTALVNGIAIGAGVLIARYIGAGDTDAAGRAVHNLTAFGLAAGTAVTVAVLLLASPILTAMGTPESILADTARYLRMYFLGGLGLVLYNAFASILQAAGDSRHPLLFVMFSTGLNIVLDILLILWTPLGVAAAGLASAISQTASALLCLRLLMKAEPPCRIVWKQVRFHRREMRGLLQYGLPAGIQNSIIGLSNTVIQSSINSFGTAAMAGIGAFMRVESFALFPMISLGMALSTYISQNEGAGKPERARRSAQGTLAAACCTGIVLGAVCWLAAPVLVSWFTQDPEAAAFGVQYGRVTTVFWAVISLSQCFTGIFRGIGRPVFSMSVILICWCGVRLFLMLVLLHFNHAVEIIYWAYPISWMLSTAVFGIEWLRIGYGKPRKRGQKE